MSTALLTLWQRWRHSQKQRIYIIPTRAGYAFVGLLIVMLLGAINYNNSLGHLLCFLLASIGHVTMHHSHRNLRLLTPVVTPLEPVFLGQPAKFMLSLKNEDETNSYQLEVAYKKVVKLPRWQFLKAYEPIKLISEIEAANTLSCTLAIATLQRGWQSLGDIRLASQFPLGLFYSWTVYPQQTSVLVYPAPKGKRPLPTPPAAGKHASSIAHPGDDDFSGLRNYREGEPLHRVAWKALARDEVMRSKQFSSPQGAELMLRWQDVENISNLEDRLSQLCRWIIMAENAGHRYGLSIPGVHIQAGRGETHQHRCLKSLALYNE